MLGRYRDETQIRLYFLKLLKRMLQGKKMVWELLSSSQMQLIFLKLVDTTGICMLPGKIPAHAQATPAYL